MTARLLAALLALVLAAGLMLGLGGCDAECAGHGGVRGELAGIFYCHDGTKDYG